MKNKPSPMWLSALTCLLLSMTGCSSSTGTLSRDPVAYLRFTGATDGMTAAIDELPPVAPPLQGRSPTLQVSPGRHRVKVLRGSSVVVDRQILVSDLQTLEIPVP